MYHSVTFITSGLWHPTKIYTGGEVRKNSWDDWHLIPTSRPAIAPPNARTVTSERSLCDGVFDFSQTLFGKITYGFREGEIEFLIDNGHMLWCLLYSEIMDTIHGQYARLYLEDEPDCFYEGRLFVKEFRSEKDWSYITVAYKLNVEKVYIEPEEPDEPDEPEEIIGDIIDRPIMVRNGSYAPSVVDTPESLEE